MSTEKGHHNMDQPSDHCPRLTAFIYGEHCDDLSIGEAIGTWTAFVFLIGAMALSFLYAVYRILPYALPQYFELSPISLPSSSKLRGGDLRRNNLHNFSLRGGTLPSWTKSLKPDYNLKFRITAWSWGGMAQYTKLLKSEEAHWRVQEQVKNHPDKWQSIEIPVIPGWNCPEARERERVARDEAAMNQPAVKEEGEPRRGRFWSAWATGLMGTAAQRSEAGTAVENGPRDVSSNGVGLTCGGLGMPMQDLPPRRESFARASSVRQGPAHEDSKDDSTRESSFQKDDSEAGSEPRGFPSERLGRGGSERGGYLVDISSDEESDKEWQVKSFGMGSSNSRQSEKQNLSWRKREKSS